MKYSTLKIIVGITLISCFAGCLFSCSTANKHFQKALFKDSAYVAKQTRILWPCVVTGSDTTTVTDTLYDFIDCPDSEYLTTKTDTATGTTHFVTNTVKVPVKVPVKTVYVTTKIEDSAKIFSMQNDFEVVQDKLIAQNEVCNGVVASLQADNDKLKGKVAKRNKFILWLIIVCGVLGLLNYIQFRR